MAVSHLKGHEAKIFPFILNFEFFLFKIANRSSSGWCPVQHLDVSEGLRLDYKSTGLSYFGFSTGNKGVQLH